MAKDAVEKFYERMTEDEKLQRDYAEAMDRASAEAVAGFASDNGFDFSVDELVDTWSSQTVELSEDDLDGVAGGGGMGMMASFGMGGAMQRMSMCLSGMILGKSKCDTKCDKIGFLMKKCEGKCDKLF